MGIDCVLDEAGFTGIDYPAASAVSAAVKDRTLRRGDHDIMVERLGSSQVSQVKLRRWRTPANCHARSGQYPCRLGRSTRSCGHGGSPQKVIEYDFWIDHRRLQLRDSPWQIDIRD